VTRLTPPIARTRRARRTALATCVVVAAGAGAVALPAQGQDLGGNEAKDRVERAVGFLQDVQNPDGGVPLKRGGASDPAVSAWAALAVASAGISPRDQTVKGGTSLWEYLQDESGELQSTDDLARLALVARAAKSSPVEVGSVTPVATIAGRQDAEGGVADPGSGTPTVTSTAWAAIALQGAEGGAAPRRRALGWLEAARNTDGGWPVAKGGASDATATGLALQALRPAASTGGEALTFLRSVQRSGGGLARRRGGAPESLPTALAIQGLVAAEVSREPLASGASDPTTFLWRRQADSGAVGSVLATAQVAPALAERPYPLRAVSSKGPTNTGTPVEDEDEGGTTSTDAAPATSSSGSTAPGAVAGATGGADATGDDLSTGGSGAAGDVAGAAPPASTTPATTTSAAPPTTTTGPTPPARPSAGGDQVSGSVVGSTEAAPAAATGGGSGGDDEDRTALVLFGVIVLFVALGAWLESRPGRLRGVAS